MAPKKTFTAGRSVKKNLTRQAVNRQAAEWWLNEKRKLSKSQLCDRCGAVWFDGHWHTAPAMAAVLKAKRKLAKGASKPVLCYECHLAVNGPGDGSKARFEGELTLDGLDDPAAKAEILKTVRNFGSRASKRDPEDRIINIDDRGERVVVTTSENQLAVGLGKAVDAAFKGGRLRIVWSKEDLPARAYWMRKGGK